MKKSRVFFFGGVLGVVVIALVISAFWAGSASAATGCFLDTNGHWAETFICWMKDNNITTGIGGGNYGPEQFVTRAQMAVFMQRASNVPPQTGLILVSAGHANWFPLSAFSSTEVTRFSTFARFSRPTTGSEFFTIQPSFTPVLYGRSVQLVGVEFCYTAAAGVVLDYVEINTTTASTNAGTRTIRVGDDTDRSGAACRYYVLASPVTLTRENGVSFYAGIKWTVASANFDIGRTTFVFQPTDVVEVAPSSLSNDVVILSESTNDATLPDTSAP